MTLETLADDQVALLKRVGERLKEMRLRAGLSQDEVAERLEISRSHVSNMEKGRSNTTVTRLHDLALLYGCTVGEIVF